jgi:formiminoglutamase
MPVHQPDHVAVWDVGDIECPDEDLEMAQEALAKAVEALLSHHFIPIVIGGGHEMAWGHFQGISRSLNAPIGIINFDAHFDLRPLLKGDKGSSGTSFLQISNYCEKMKQHFSYLCVGIQKCGNTEALFHKAKELGVQYLSAEEVALQPEASLAKIKQYIQQHDKIYLTICLDGFAAPFAPGVSAPQSLGLSPWMVLPALELIATSGKLVSFDIAELSPPYDQGGVTAHLTASLVCNLIILLSKK